MIYDYMKDAEYKAIVKEYVEAMAKKKKQIDRDVKPERIKKDADEAVKRLSEKVADFYNKRMADIHKKKHAIEQSYKKTGQQYDNPQAEILRRQDFEAELAVASDSELEAIANDTDRELSKYELNKLQLEFKERDLTSHSIMRKRLDVKNEFQTDPNYQRLLQEEQKLYLTKPRTPVTDTWILYPSTEEGERPRMKSLKELTSSRPLVSVEELQEGYKALEKQVSSNSSYMASFNPVLKNEAEDFAKEAVKKGTHKFNEYSDVDLRALKGSSKYDVTHRFKYLKERYHDDTNEIYAIDNPNYSVYDHYTYLEKQHELHLKNSPSLKGRINDALEIDAQNNPTDEQTE